MSTQQADMLARVHGAAIDGRLKVLRYRQRQFIALHDALLKHHDALLEAIQVDDDYSLEEAKIIYGSAIIELRNHYDALDFSTDFSQEYALAKSTSNEKRRIPIEIAYIIPDAFSPVFGILSALCAALEAGTCVVIELENTLRTSLPLLKRILLHALDNDAFAIIESRAPPQFLSQCVIVEQRGDNVPSKITSKRILASPLARNIAVVDRTADVELAAAEIIASRLAFHGRSPYAVDLLFVNEFVEERLTTAIIELLQKNSGATKVPKSSSSSFARRTENELLEREASSGRTQYLFGNVAFGLLRINDRHSDLLTRKVSHPLVVICKITSLDDIIDTVDTGEAQKFPVGALYLFSGAKEAKYLSQNIASQASYVNHIPAQLTVGPVVPLGYQTKLQCRYTRDMFETPSPQMTLGPRSHLMSTIFKKAAFIDKVAQRPLKPTGQAPSGAWGFFEQGIIIGALVYLLPIVGISTAGIGLAFWKGLHGFSG